MEKKYELVMDTSIIIDYHRTIYRIRALRDFNDVKAGDMGGYVEGYHNLSHEGNCWIYDDAEVYENARVFDHARIYGNAEVYGRARVYGNTLLYDNARIFDHARIYGNARVYGNAKVYGDARVFDKAYIFDNARVYGDLRVFDNAIICNNADISSNNDYLFIRGLGSENRYTTAFRLPNGIYVKCGCFGGTLSEFESKVNDTHGDNKYGREYNLLIDMIKVHFDLI